MFFFITACILEDHKVNIVQVFGDKNFKFMRSYAYRDEFVIVNDLNGQFDFEQKIVEQANRTNCLVSIECTLLWDTKIIENNCILYSFDSKTFSKISFDILPFFDLIQFMNLQTEKPENINELNQIAKKNKCS